MRPPPPARRRRRERWRGHESRCRGRGAAVCLIQLSSSKRLSYRDGHEPEFPGVAATGAAAGPVGTKVTAHGRRRTQTSRSLPGRHGHGTVTATTIPGPWRIRLVISIRSLWASEPRSRAVAAGPGPPWAQRARLPWSPVTQWESP